MAVPGWGRNVHHVAMLASGDLLLAADDEALWRKLREKMTCPTIEAWGADVMPEVHQSGMLLECEAFGIPDGFRAYVPEKEAQPIFDGRVSDYVRRTGLRDNSDIEAFLGIPLPAFAARRRRHSAHR